jgi:phage shock protein PspC (stress-responsive transcriptional regulator)
MADPQETIIDSTARELPGPKHLYRSTTNRAVAGVCGGLGERFGVDVGVVRIAWLISIFLTLGVSLLIYLALAYLIPKEPAEVAAVKVVPASDLWQRLKENSTLLWAALLVMVGVVLLLNNFDLLPWRLEALWRTFSALLLPVLLIGAGVYLVLSFTGRAPDLRQLRQSGQRLPLRRSRQDRMIAGVCGGLARYLNIDSLVVRIGWVLISVITVGTVGVIAYIAAVLLFPASD